MTASSFSVPIERLPVKFVGDDRWVITRPFMPPSEHRVRNVMQRVAGLAENEVEEILGRVLVEFGHRHKDIEKVFQENFDAASAVVEDSIAISRSRRLLIGSYFTMEYSIASAALFNPSIVPHPGQTDVPSGGMRFIMSLRATGEGHISSIVFRTGIIGADGAVSVDEPGPTTHRTMLSTDRQYEKQLFRRKLRDITVKQEAVDLVMDDLGDVFTMSELERAIERVGKRSPSVLQMEQTTESMLWLARENYQIKLPDDASVSEAVIFPQSENEKGGIEDLRLVRFVEDDGSTRYYGTYTAYNGYQVLPQLMEAIDFRRITIHTLNGACVQNKGLALFPRRIDGHYCMCSRIDGENLYIMYSDIVQFWETAELLQTPKHPWEFTQLGNCGSPLETPQGWLLLTHGVGPMRSYCIGAMLLDLENPLKVIGHLDQPLIMPTEDEREGYVPNVVYTCGALVHHDRLFIPYAMSDVATGFAVVELQPLLERLCG